MTTTDGNIALCAGHDVHIEDTITLTARHHDPGAEPRPAARPADHRRRRRHRPGRRDGVLEFTGAAPPITVTATVW